VRLGLQDKTEFGAVVHAELGIGVVQVVVHGAD
jgi:hypothetical protein